jgi:hypothetical protein
MTLGRRSTWLFGAAALALACAAPARAEPRHFTVAVVGDKNERCAGVLVAPTAILTLAECIVGMDDVIVVIPVLWGMTLDLKVKRARVHPRFDPVGLRREDNPYNLALLDMDRPFPPPYRPVSLPAPATATPQPGQELSVASYGLARDARGDKAAALDTARFRDVGTASRASGVAKLAVLGKPLPCPNDRGAPVLREGPNGPELAGIVTAPMDDAGRCIKGTSAIRVEAVLPWIRGILQEWAPGAQASGEGPKS